MNNKVFNKNRENLMNMIEDNSVVVFLAGEAKYKSADEKYPFTPNRNFYYLTGIDEEKDILLMSKIDGEVAVKLFIQEPDEVMAKWVGATYTDEEALELSGAEEVNYLGSFEAELNKVLTSGDVENLYLDLERRAFDEEDRPAQKFARKIKRRYLNIEIKDAYQLVSELRLVKSEEEIAEMQKAMNITSDAVEYLMKNCKAGITEGALEAYYDFYIKGQGVKDRAFNTIAAAGKNATILHYVENNCELKDGELILFDLGAQWNYYNADISRTFPISGKFTERQKEVYEEVLKVNEAIIEAIKPGVMVKELNDLANDMLGEACVKLGLLKDKADFRKYYFHSIGHSLGLDTHDVGKRNVELKPGMVWTVEPGLYIPEEAIGIRIEDDVLVTENGREVLTKASIKSVEEIEKFMANR
ncbi:MAG: aminopeptidase P family protein [Sarcina sp.]